MEQVKEERSDATGTRWLENLFRDFRFGLRMLNKYRTGSLAAITSLALAIGACTGAFALIDALIFRPVPLWRSMSRNNGQVPVRLPSVHNS